MRSFIFTATDICIFNHCFFIYIRYSSIPGNCSHCTFPVKIKFSQAHFTIIILKTFISSYIFYTFIHTPIKTTTYSTTSFNFLFHPRLSLTHLHQKLINYHTVVLKKPLSSTLTLLTLLKKGFLKLFPVSICTIFST